MATATLLLSPSPRLFLHPSSSSSSSHCFGPSLLGLGRGLGRARPWLELPSRAESSKRRRSRGNSTALRVAVDPDHPSSFLFFLLDAGYSPASYYTSLGLFVISVPGLWSLIKRSVKSKASIENKKLKMAFSLFEEMKRFQLQPNSVTYNTLLRARSRYGSLYEVQRCLAVYQDM